MTKIIAIIGITGNQGSSVAEAFAQQSEWAVRGVTRDPSKPAARSWSDRGVDVVAGDIDNVSTINQAFKNANVVFGTTDFVQHLQDPNLIAQAEREKRAINELATEREFEQAKKIIDAAAANVDSLDRFVLSTLSDTKGLSKGKIQYNLHFDCKWAAVEYLKREYPKLWAKTSLLQLGIFMSNWKVPYYTPRKQGDGTFKLLLPMSGSRKFPIVDPNADTGRFVQALVQAVPGMHLVGAASMSDWNEWCDTWGKVNNVQCTFERLNRKVFEDMMGPLGREIADMFQYMEDFGYDGGDTDTVYPWDLGLDLNPTALEEYLRKQDFTSIL